MEALIVAAAARSLAVGDPLGALKRVGTLNDPSAMALRGLALAQIGDLETARNVLKQAAKAFGAERPVARARCIVAEAEIALVSRDLGWPQDALEDARAVLDAQGDQANAAHARQMQVRRLLLLGKLDEAERLLDATDFTVLTSAGRAAHELTSAGIHIRRIAPDRARAALARAAKAAREPGVPPALAAEVAKAVRAFEAPSARVVLSKQSAPLSLQGVAALLASNRLIVDACRLLVRRGETILSFASRPVLFAILQALAEDWPDPTRREDLICRAFGGREADESHRARLRVEVTRLRAELVDLAGIGSTPDGFRLLPQGETAVLIPPTDAEHAGVLALLMDGEAWSTSSLAIATGASQRTLQRALEGLASAGLAENFGRGPARRWIATQAVGFPSVLLLPGRLSTGASLKARK